MTADTVKAIAAICQIIAGYNPSFGDMASIIETKQIECHAFYAKCLDNKDIKLCMIEYPNFIKSQYLKQNGIKK